ncbi:retrovirus-related Pol polyprotein from transposon 297 [Trichonephila clavipes]|nr:retrovirus-related Pol polyprotein from transposon 297 [Trichonephila clavipes]
MVSGRGESISDLEAMFGVSTILKQADFSKPFLIRTDASNYALGAVLLQGEDKEEHPVEFASRLLNPAKRNYSSTEREALAVVWAVNKFRGYIDGASITVASDHQPLRWLMKLKSPTGRLARWALQLQSFNLNMEYIPGKSNVIADMLSRPACKEENELCEVCTVAIDVPSRSPKEIRDEQMKDEELVKIIFSLEDTDKNVNYVNWVERGYLMNQSVLFRYAPDSESEEAQLVIPSHERTLILKNHHDAPIAGHYGADGTYTRIAKNYYWTEKLSFIRFALKTAKCETTGQTAAFLNFGRELRTPSEVVNDILVVIQNDNFVPEIIPYLKKFAKFYTQIREVVEEQQDSRKFYADKKRKVAPTYQPGEHVFVASHPLSNAAQVRSAKLMPRREGPYVILTQRSPSSYEIASLDNPGVPLGVYHTSCFKSL